MQKGRDRNSSVTNYGNHSFLKSKSSSSKKKNVSPLETKNYKECKLLSSMLPFVTGEKNRQVIWFLLVLLCVMGLNCTHRHMQRKRSASLRDTGHRSSQCLPGVLGGSSISFHSNALFVDKSKLMIVKREAFGGKILLTLLRLNLTTEQDTSSCRNDRLL